MNEAKIQIGRSARRTDEEASLKNTFEDVLRAFGDAVSHASRGKPVIIRDIGELLTGLEKLLRIMSDLLGERNRESTDEEISFYLRLFRFVETAGHIDEHYYIQVTREGRGQGMIKIFCADPSGRLRESMDRAVATVLFSATLLPIRYYKALLGGTDEDYEAYAETSFDLSGQMGVFIGTDVTTRYSERGRAQYERIARYLAGAVNAKAGKYMAFFPSWKMLYDVRAYLAYSKNSINI